MTGDEVSGPFEKTDTGIQESEWVELEDVIQPYSGIVANYGSELAVSQHTPLAAMSVDVAIGGSVIKSSRYRNKVIKTVTIDAADSTQDRYDLIVVQRTLNPPSSTIVVTVHKGTNYTAGTAVAPDPTRTSTVYELVLATVFVAHGTTAITTAMITDDRLSANCGYYSPAAGGMTVVPATGDFDFDGQKLTNVADPVEDTDVDTLGAREAAIIDAISAQWKRPVAVATTIAGTLASAFANGQTVDGYTLITGDRILIQNQSTASENGIYVVAASGAPARATDFDSSAEILGASIPVIGGNTWAGQVIRCTNTGTVTVGSTSLTFATANTGGVKSSAAASPTVYSNATTRSVNLNNSGGPFAAQILAIPLPKKYLKGSVIRVTLDGETTQYADGSYAYIRIIQGGNPLSLVGAASTYTNYGTVIGSVTVVGGSTWRTGLTADITLAVDGPGWLIFAAVPYTVGIFTVSMRNLVISCTDGPLANDAW